ncbi:MAG: endopeptidase La [Clostridia bacterium]|nr:endopeptidase La [Clostridia bacterium]
MPKYIEKAERILLPVIPLRGIVAFPSIPLEVENPDSSAVLAANAAEEYDGLALAVAVKPDSDSEVNNETEPKDLFAVGTVVRVHLQRGEEGKRTISCECLCRASVNEYYLNDGLITAAGVRKEVSVAEGDLKGEAYCEEMRKAFKRLCAYFPNPPASIEIAVRRLRTPELLADLIAASVLGRFPDKQEILEEFDPYKRCERLLILIDEECHLLDVERDIHGKTQGRIAHAQREYYLREQMKVIEEELGEDQDPDDCTFKILGAHLPEEVREKLLKENERLSKTPYGSAEATVLRNYIDVALDIPWTAHTKDRLNVAAAKKILDADHDGLTKVKERILEFLAVKQLNPELRNQIICLVGPPGTGKTSIAASVAHAMNRRYVRVSLGGVHDEADIRGHRKTYVASMPGRIISALTQAKVNNPLILLDEIDKVSSDSRGDPSSALLEVLDPEQNKSFRDHFVEIPFDLSDCLFITTANTLDTIPRPLIDRMEVIELPGYTRREKLSIAKNHLLPKQLRRHGMNKRMLKLTDEAVYEIIDCYTREAGVRNLERTVAELCRKTAKKIVESSGEIKRITVDKDDVKTYLGARKLLPISVSDEDLVGVVNGLAYTEAGGDLLKIEAAVMEGTGKLELTGSLGDVMKESARAALTYVRSVASEYGIPSDFYKNRDIHIHVPEGAVPKDGPSAGVTMTTALISALSGIPAAHDVAMTGEVTLTGRVLAIGGLREKTMAAYAAGVKTVLIPEENVPDLEEIDSEVRQNIRFIPCRHVREVLKNALVTTDAVKSTGTPAGSTVLKEQN